MMLMTLVLVHLLVLLLLQGSHTSWKVLDFFSKISRTWTVLENEFCRGKSLKLKFKVLEFTCGST